MIDEIIEAIAFTYEKEEDIAVDCLVWLRDKLNTPYTYKIENYLEENGRCPLCGAKLEAKEHREYHSEVDDWETIVYIECPECGC